MVQTWLTSYGSPDYYTCLELLRMSAYMQGDVDQVVLWTEKDDDLPESRGFAHLKGAMPDMFNCRVRGRGYYSLKACIIKQTLLLMQPDDVLVYCDSTCLIRKQLAPLVSRADVTLFKLSGQVYKNKDWTKPKLFDLMDSHESSDLQQLNAAVQVYKNTSVSMSFVCKYAHWCTQASVMSEDGFAQHRHDQSVLTILAYDMAAGSVIQSDIATQYGVYGDGAPIQHHRHVWNERDTISLDIITPTILRNRAQLAQCLQSVQDQQGIPIGIRVRHWVVLDGIDVHESSVISDVTYKSRVPIHVVKLPMNTGKDGFNGHKIYAAMSVLLDGTYITFLDEDNWLERNHVSSLMKVASTNRAAEGVFTLRNVHEYNGQFVCRDLCESLGNHRHSILGKGDHFCDTSTLMIKRSVAQEFAPLWLVPARPQSKAGYENKMEADRALSKAILNRKKCVGTRRCTVNYRLGGSRQSVQSAFFLAGNRDMQPHWDPKKPDLYVFHFGPQQTARMLDHRGSTLKDAMLEWQPTLFNSVNDVNLINGYDHMDVIPPHAIVYASLCFPQELPLEKVFSRTDIFRIVYTVESPNLAHHQQWQKVFLTTFFDAWMTYWEPLLCCPQALLCYHNTHHLTPSPSIEHLLLTNQATDGSICMVLANRPGCKSYSVDNQMLTQLDGMRSTIISDLNVTVYGINWIDFARDRPNILVGGSKGKERDDRSAVDIMNKYAFTVIVENCDAENYVSEKMYDAFIAGSIPVYYGNVGRVPIPSDMYVNIQDFSSSKQLQAHLASIDITQMREVIYKKRSDVLSMVSTAAFSKSLYAAIARAGSR